MTKLISTYRGILFCLLALLGTSCRKETAANLSLEANGETIWVYLSKNPSYSILKEALEITKVSDNLKIYGNMTLFAPTNEAFEKYLKRKGISSISRVNPDTLKNLLKYHIYNEKYISSFFVQGTLPTPTTNGGYIKFDISEGLRDVILNGSTTIDRLDILTSNGAVHVINEVLEPSSSTMYEWLKLQPDYSIMFEAFEKTGNADLLLKPLEYDSDNIVYGQPAVKLRTVFLETNDVLRQAGIKSFEELADRYSQNYTGNKDYLDPSDSLNVFVRFHVLNRKYFISDFSDTYLESASPNDFLVFNVTGGLSVNKHIKETLSGTDTIRTEVKVGIDLVRSNTITKNGIVNAVTSVLEPLILKPVPVKVLFSGDLFERGIKMKDGTVSTFATQFPKLGNDPIGQQVIPWLKWGFSTGFVGANPVIPYFKDNGVLLSGGISGYWYELTTKLVIKGNYEVYVNYSGQRRGSNPPTNATFQLDGQQLGDIISMADPKDAFGNTVAGDPDAAYRRKIGAVNLPRNSTHVFRVDGIANNVTTWYSLELVPVL